MRHPLLELTALLAPGNAPLVKRVSLALDDPARYAKKFAADLDDWGVGDEAVDPWLALVSGLAHERVRLACAIDWKFAAEDIVANLRWVTAAQAKLRANKKLYDAKTLLAFYDEAAHLLTKTVDFIRLCGRAFSAYGLALIELDVEGDTYVLSIVPWKDLAKVRALAKKAGANIISHAPKSPLAKPLPEPRPKPKGNVKVDTLRFADAREQDFALTPGFLLWARPTPDKPSTTLVDCGSWPPKLTKIGPDILDVAVHPRNGQRIVWRLRWAVENGERVTRPTGTLRIGSVDLLARLPDGFDIDRALWIGELAVLLPTEPTVRGRTSRRPLVWNGRTLAPAKGLPDATPAKAKARDRFPPFLRRGFACTGDGRDVLIWEGACWVAKGDRFVKSWKLVPELAHHELHVGAPLPGTGFLYPHRLGATATLREADGRGCCERARFAGVLAGPLRVAFDGRIVASLNRYAAPKKPVLVVFHPETDETTFVPPEVVGVRKDDQADAYGVSAPKKGAAFLWLLVGDELRRLSWDAILALPRSDA